MTTLYATNEPIASGLLAVACPDCERPQEARLAYLGEGRWVFSFECRTPWCENHEYQYEGEIHEIDQAQPTQAMIKAARPVLAGIETVGEPAPPEGDRED